MYLGVGNFHEFLVQRSKAEHISLDMSIIKASEYLEVLKNVTSLQTPSHTGELDSNLEGIKTFGCGFGPNLEPNPFLHIIMSLTPGILR